MTGRPGGFGERTGRWGGAGFIILIAVLMRVGLWQVYAPVEYSDTGAYFRLAEVLQSKHFNAYDGTRVPGYPAFISLIGIDPTAIWIAQMILGVMTAVVMYKIAIRTIRDPGKSVALGVFSSLFPAALFFEANLLTETLTVFLLTLSLYLYLSFREADSAFLKLTLAALLGFCASAVGLTRPVLFPLTLWLVPFVWSAGNREPIRRPGTLAAFVIFPLLMQGGWLLFMWSHYKVVSPTAIAGYNMVQHAGEFFEFLPDEHAVIRDVYLKYRAVQIAARGSQNNAIWQAVPELIEASGLSFYGLSRKLGELSWMLIREHPVRYLQNLIEGWLWFWKAPVYWQPEIITNSTLRSFLHAWILIGRGLALLANLSFLVISAGCVVSRKIRKWVKIDDMFILAGGLIWWVSILQTIFEHGDNPRFLVPLQMIIIYLVLHALTNFRQAREERR